MELKQIFADVFNNVVSSREKENLMKSNTQKQAEYRARMRDKGLVEFKVYCTPKQRDILRKLVPEILTQNR